MNDEIDLVECIKIVLKRKLMVFWVFVLAVAIVGIVSFLNFQASKKNITTNTIIEVGRVDNVLIEEPNQIAEKIKNNLYGKIIKEKLNLVITPKISASAIKDTNLVIIERISQIPEEDKLVLNEINKFLLKEHQERLETLKKYQKVPSGLVVPTKVIKEPSEIEEKKLFPVKNFFINLIIASFIGILISVFLCFVLEFWENNKGKFIEADKRGSIRG